jgi:hypothetical protein
VEGFTIGEIVETDHLPLEISIDETNHEKREKRGAKEDQKKVTIKVWHQQEVEEYRRRLEKATFEEQDVEKMATELKEVMEKATTKKEITVRGTKGTGKKIEWWDKECEQSKKQIPRSEKKRQREM